MSDLIERLKKESARSRGDDGSECCWAPKWTCCDPAVLEEAGARIRELEAERDQYKEDYLRRHKDVGDQMELRIAAEQRAEKAEGEATYLRKWSDEMTIAIEAATIERCEYAVCAVVKNGGDAVDALKAIRALAKPTSVPEAATEATS